MISNDVCLSGQNHNTFGYSPRQTVAENSLGCVRSALLSLWLSYVTAHSMALTPMNHIFTRMGAGDDICSGESTFHQELKETLEIMHEASESALVMIDELGPWHIFR